MIRIRIRSNLSVFSIALLRIRQNPITVNHCDIVHKPLMNASFNAFNSLNYNNFFAPPKFGFFVSSFCSDSSTKSTALGLDEALSDDDDNDDDDDDDHDKKSSQLHLRDDGFVKDVKTILDIIHEPGSGPYEIKQKLEDCNVKASSELVVEVLSRVRNDWEAAFTFVLFGARRGGGEEQRRGGEEGGSMEGKKLKSILN